MRDNETTKPILYALAQSRDDRTIDIVVAGRDGFVTDFMERKRIQESIEGKAPFSDTKPILIRTGKDWMSGYLSPDTAGPNGRLRPIQFVAKDIDWKMLDVAVFSECVCGVVSRLLDPAEVSIQRMDDIRHKVAVSVSRRQRRLGCLLGACVLCAGGITLLFRFFS